MSIWLAGLLAALIIFGAIAAYIFLIAGLGEIVIRLEKGMGRRVFDAIGTALILILLSFMIFTLWYVAFSWLMGWTL